MEEVNALTLRNNLGAILDRLTDSGEPVIIRKKNKIKAVLITPEQFEKRFLDWQAEHKKKQLLDSLSTVRQKKKGTLSSMDHLRALRGYKT